MFFCLPCLLKKSAKFLESSALAALALLSTSNSRPTPRCALDEVTGAGDNPSPLHSTHAPRSPPPPNPHSPLVTPLATSPCVTAAPSALFPRLRFWTGPARPPTPRFSPPLLVHLACILRGVLTCWLPLQAQAGPEQFPRTPWCVPRVTH